MAKEFLYRGKSLADLQKLSVDEFAQLVTSRARRKILRGFTDAEKKFLKDVRSNPRKIRTHCRDMIVLPEFVGKTIEVHNGKRWVPVEITVEMLGLRLGELALTRNIVKHSSPGIGATRSSSALSVR